MVWVAIALWASAANDVDRLLEIVSVASAV
jgi:hypothetical protein